MRTVAIKTMDAAWLYIEKREAPVHFGPLLIMSPPKGASATFVRDLVQEWRRCQHFEPPFNYRFARRGLPKWELVDGEDMDMEYHLLHNALPFPGGEQELGVLVSRLHSHRLDRKHPLWQCYVIEGLEGGRFALYLKLHHSQLDGMGAARLIQRSFSVDADARGMPPPWSIGMTPSTDKTPERSRRRPDFGRLASIETLSSIGKSLTALTRAAYLGGDEALFAPFQGPDSILNARITQHRRYATQRYELARVKRAADACQVKVNDIFLAITGAALRRYLLEINQLPDKPLVGQIPTSIRPQGDSSVGNALAFIYATLGTDLEDPFERVQAIHRSTESAKTLQSGLTKAAVEPFTALMLAPYITEVMLGLGGRVRPAANLVISNVLGPRERLYFNGAKIEHIYGPSVLFHGQALNITMSSYADEINIGYTACRDTLPSMQRLAVFSGEALEALECTLGLKINRAATSPAGREGAGSSA